MKTLVSRRYSYEKNLVHLSDEITHGMAFRIENLFLATPFLPLFLLSYVNFNELALLQETNSITTHFSQNWSRFFIRNGHLELNKLIWRTRISGKNQIVLWRTVIKWWSQELLSITVYEKRIRLVVYIRLCMNGCGFLLLFNQHKRVNKSFVGFTRKPHQHKMQWIVLIAIDLLATHICCFSLICCFFCLFLVISFVSIHSNGRICEHRWKNVRIN